MGRRRRTRAARRPPPPHVRHDPALPRFVERQRAGDPIPAIGPELRRLREERGLTQAELARRLGITQPEVSRLEQRNDVRVSTATSYVRALGGELRLVADFGGSTFTVDSPPGARTQSR
ncbi:MAG: helix-turn-helix transcriptional regulator [Actinobacteria bacterium]|nr:helix-turn-helix transcriptional regulator [Actinomycetota bacterium]